MGRAGRVVFHSAVWIALSGVMLVPAAVRVQELQQKDTALTQELSRLKSENRRLSEEIDMLEHDAVYIEQVAREKLRVARKDETIVRLINYAE